MSALDAEVIQHGTRVDGLLGDRARPRMPAAPSEAASVIGDEPVVISQGGLRQERTKGIGQDGAVDEQHRLAGALDLVL